MRRHAFPQESLTAQTGRRMRRVPVNMERRCKKWEGDWETLAHQTDGNSLFSVISYGKKREEEQNKVFEAQK